MPLTLTLRNTDRLDNGSPISLVLDRRGAIIGRAATIDWCLPDPTRELSSRHCEIQFRDGAYVLTDISTNGTFLLGSAGRLPGPRNIAAGDVFVIGQFEIEAALDDATAAAMAARNAAPPPPTWKGWGPSGGADAASPSPAASGWDAVPASSAISGSGPMAGNWAAPAAIPAADTGASSGGWGATSAVASGAASGAASPQVAWAAPAQAPFASPPSPPSPPAQAGAWGAAPPPAEPSTGGWGAPVAPPAANAFPAMPSSAAPTASTWETPPPPTSPASNWSTPITAPPPPSAADVWGQVAASNVVDWARGGFGAPAPTPAFEPTPAPTFAALPNANAQAAPIIPPPEQTAMMALTGAPTDHPAANADSGASGIEHLLTATGLAPSALKQEPAAALRQAGDVLRRLVAGFVVMLEARARAKSQLGAAGTSLEFDGNNPLKFARTPEQALAQLLNPAERGFMGADRAIEDAFRDLQAHQVATLKAMQGALRATLDRFSPTAIRGRADQKGLIAKILPGARDAALWQTYEREFGGVAQGSDEAFMDVFAKEFRKAYDETVRGG